MQDGKALQAGTSHFLGQNFARAFECTFQNENNESEYVWATSWGVSTRLIGALIMTHGDDQGVIMPPKLAPVQVAIVPITRAKGDNSAVLDAARQMRDALLADGVRVVLDDRDQYRPGWKFAQYEVEGVPVRLAVGPRDVENGTAEMARRDSGDKETVGQREITGHVRRALHGVQQGLYDRALAFRKEHTHAVDSYDDFKAQIEDGGFVLMHWDGTAETEARVKEETKATIRCVPFPDQFPGVDTEAPGTDPVSGAPSAGRVVFARAY